MIDLRQTEEYANFMRTESFIVEKKGKTFYYLKKIPFLGSILKVQRTSNVDFNFITHLSRKYGVFLINIEPDTNIKNDILEKLTASGFKISRKPFLPTKTLRIDLKKPISQINKGLKRNITKGLKMGEDLIKQNSYFIKEYSTLNQIKVFREAWKDAIKNKRYVPSIETLWNLKKSFPQNKSLFLASHNISGKIIGGVIFTTSSHEVSNYIIFDTVNYMYGFTTAEGRSSLSHATLLYKGILWGKKLNYNVFDFEGIYDSRFPIAAWRGFTQFKKSFGGTEVTYPGCYTKFRLPL